MKYAQLICNDQCNVGDDIQALAAAQHLPRIDMTIDREAIQHHRIPAAVIMNGWFSRNPAAWPPRPEIKPIFVGFHVTEHFKETVKQHVDYLKLHEPIGTRDKASADFLRSLGVKAEVTYCLTLTFPQRQQAPRDGKVFLVDAESIAVPRALRSRAIKVTHTVAPVGHQVTLPYARRLLDTYRDQASLVITTRLHAALPCIAMGIPVVYFGRRSDGRTTIIEDIGGTIYDAQLHAKSLARGAVGRLLQSVDWAPKPLDVAGAKQRLTLAVKERYGRLIQYDVAS